MSRRARQVVQITPMPDADRQRVEQMVTALGLSNGRAEALHQLARGGALTAVGIEGEQFNYEEAIETLMAEFGCTRATARRHVLKAAKRKRSPHRPAQWGGARPGAGRPPRTAAGRPPKNDKGA